LSWKKVAYLDEVATLSNTAPQDVKVQTAAAGSGTAASRDDHKHNVTVGVPGSITENATPAEGTSVNLARSDHVHGSPADWTPKAHTLDSHSEKKLDTLDEKTLDAGVTVDACLIKDGKVADSNKLEGSTKAQVQDHAPQSHALSGHTQATAELLINKQALRNPVIDPQATAPSTPVDGQVYYSTADDHAYIYVA